MANERIDFSNSQESGVTSLSGAMPLASNVVTVGRGVIRRRPGLARWAGAPEAAIHDGPITLVKESLDGRLWAVGLDVVDHKIYKVLPAGANYLYTGTTSRLLGAKRPTAVETEMLLVFAAGEYPQRVELQTETPERLTLEIQPTHLVAMGQRLIANDYKVQKGLIRYSEIAFGDEDFTGHTEWRVGVGTAGYLDAESSPDAVVGLFEITGYLVALGQETVQFFTLDPVSVLAPIITYPIGCGAPYSAVTHNDAVFFMDETRRFVKATPNGVEYISEQIQRTLDESTYVLDCFGFSVKENNAEYLVWVFPTDGRAFCYQDRVGWSQWQGWSGAQWEPIPISAHCRRYDGPENLVGTTDGKVAWLTSSVSTDFGEPIRAYVQTGRINRGTEALKHCSRVSVTLRRGHATGASSTHAVLGYRDDPGQPWQKLPVRLGASGDYEPVVHFYSLGVYRGREWMFEFSGPDDLDLVGVMEEYTVE